MPGRWSGSGAEVRAEIETWRHFNEMRPHSSLGYEASAELVATIMEQDAAPAKATTGRTAAACAGSALRRAAQPPRKGQVMEQRGPKSSQAWSEQAGQATSSKPPRTGPQSVLLDDRIYASCTRYDRLGGPNSLLLVVPDPAAKATHAGDETHFGHRNIAVGTREQIADLADPTFYRRREQLLAEFFARLVLE